MLLLTKIKRHHLVPHQSLVISFFPHSNRNPSRSLNTDVERKSTSSSSSPPATPPPSSAGGGFTFSSLRDRAKQYGPPFLITYATIYVGGGVALYGLFEFNILDASRAWNNLVNFTEDYGFGQYINFRALDKKYLNIALAFGINEILDPIRLPLTLALVPFVSRRYNAAKTTSSPPVTTTVTVTSEEKKKQ